MRHAPRRGSTSLAGGDDLTPDPLSRRERGSRRLRAGRHASACLLLPLSPRERGSGGEVIARRSGVQRILIALVVAACLAARPTPRRPRRSSASASACRSAAPGRTDGSTRNGTWAPVAVTLRGSKEGNPRGVYRLRVETTDLQDIAYRATVAVPALAAEGLRTVTGYIVPGGDGATFRVTVEDAEGRAIRSLSLPSRESTRAPVVGADDILFFGAGAGLSQLRRAAEKLDKPDGQGAARPRRGPAAGGAHDRRAAPARPLDRLRRGRRGRPHDGQPRLRAAALAGRRGPAPGGARRVGPARRATRRLRRPQPAGRGEAARQDAAHRLQDHRRRAGPETPRGVARLEQARAPTGRSSRRSSWRRSNSATGSMSWSARGASRSSSRRRAAWAASCWWRSTSTGRTSRRGRGRRTSGRGCRREIAPYLPNRAEAG